MDGSASPAALGALLCCRGQRLCLWAKQAGTMPGRATGNSARVKRLPKGEVIRASFTFKSVPSKDGLAYVTECHNIQNPALAASVRGASKAPSDHGSA